MQVTALWVIEFITSTQPPLLDPDHELLLSSNGGFTILPPKQTLIFYLKTLSEAYYVSEGQRDGLMQASTIDPQFRNSNNEIINILDRSIERVIHLASEITKAHTYEEWANDFDQLISPDHRKFISDLLHLREPFHLAKNRSG